ncbi:MAG TPA: hypothetical protein VGQ42_14885 [Candidatus Dormibacteraeota bacterium]|nr:hypothetical protein [Candidatus Dormibacteraeota bacterium]
MTVSACGSSATGGASPSAGPSTSSSAPPSGVPTAAPADRGLSAFALLDAAGYRAALGEDVLGPEDDGGVPSSPAGHVSTTRVGTTTTDTMLSITLSSLDTAQAAQQVFAAQTRGNPPPSVAAGLGDKAVQSNGVVTVLKGAQVLVVKASPGAAAQKRLDDIKIHGGDPTAAYAALLGKAQTLAPGLVAHLTGQASPAPRLALPAGGVDPCIRQDVIAKLYPKAPPTVTYQPSEVPPATQCSIQFPGGIVAIQVVSDQQLSSALVPTTAAKQLAADRATHQGVAMRAPSVILAQAPGPGGVQDLAPMNGFSAANPEPDVETQIGRCLFRLSLPGSHHFTPGGDAYDYDAHYLESIIAGYLDSRARGIRLEKCATADEIAAQLRDLDALRNSGQMTPLTAALAAIAAALLAFP